MSKRERVVLVDPEGYPDKLDAVREMVERVERPVPPAPSVR